MPDPKYLDTRQHRRIAYHQLEPHGAGKGLPPVVFLGGFRSDMEGSKALFLEKWAREAGRAFLRFDYSGHGLSSGDFLEGAIGDWAEDALEVISTLTSGAQILVGSSMGGWISLLVAKQMPKKIAGLVGVAAAPDFTEDSMWAGFSPDQKAELSANGQVALPSDYSDDPYVITKRLIEEGRGQLVLRDPLNLSFPVRLLHGTQDKDVEISVPLRLLDHATGPDISLTLVKGADHRFSEPRELRLIKKAIHSVTKARCHA